MKSTTQVSAIFNCSLERAFQAPILGDATQFLNGYLLQPPVIRFEDDETWGQVNGIRYPVVKANFLFKESRIFLDEILKREENKYWKWQVYKFTTWTLFFVKKGIGEWKVEQLADNEIKVNYTYSYYPKHVIYYPLAFLFVKIQIKGMMKKAIRGIKLQAESGNPFVYNHCCPVTK